MATASQITSPKERKQKRKEKKEEQEKRAPFRARNWRRGDIHEAAISDVGSTRGLIAVVLEILTQGSLGNGTHFGGNLSLLLILNGVELNVTAGECESSSSMWGNSMLQAIKKQKSATVSREFKIHRMLLYLIVFMDGCSVHYNDVAMLEFDIQERRVLLAFGLGPERHCRRTAERQCRDRRAKRLLAIIMPLH